MSRRSSLSAGPARARLVTPIVLPASERVQIVVLCTANRFRSPLAAGILTARLAGLPIDVHSYGVLDVGPLPPLVQALRAGEEFGLNLATHRSRKLGSGGLAMADLVLGFERAHVVAAIEEGYARAEIVFTFPDLVRLLEASGRLAEDGYVESVRNLIAYADRLRTTGADRKAEEIADPIGKSERVFDETAQRIRALAVALSQQLSPQG